MKSRFIYLIALSTISISLIITSPIINAAYFPAEEQATAATPLFAEQGHEESLFSEETSFQELEFDVSPSLAKVYSQLKAKEYDAALKTAQQLRQAQSDSPDLLSLMGLAYSGKGEQVQAETAFNKALRMDPGNLNAATYLARMALQRGNFAAADKYYQQILKYHPDHQPTLLMQEKLSTRNQFQEKDFDNALKTAEKLNKHYPDQADPLALMGIAYIGKGDIEKAKNVFEQALKLEPGNPNAAINLALLTTQAGDFDTARIYYQQILQYHPNNLKALFMLADVEVKQGNKALALAYVQKAVEQNPEAMQPRVVLARFYLHTGDAQQALVTLNKIPTQYAAHPLLLETLGEAQLANKDWASAQHTLQKLLKLQPESAQAHYLIGAAYLANKDRSTAKSALFKGLKLNPDLLAASQLMTLMVTTETNLKDKDKFIQALKKAQPEHPQVMDIEAQLALTHGDASKAMVIYKKLQQRYPDTSVWVKALARAQWQAGEKEVFLATLNNWLQSHPHDVNMRYMQASAYMQLNKESEAKAALTQVIKQSPDYVPALNNLAWLSRNDDPKQALAYAERANQLSPKNPAVMDTLGVLLLQQGDKVKALALLDQAQALAPKNSSIVFHYAQALQANGKSEQTRKILSDLRSQQFPEQKQAQALFESLQ
ncbi:MAG: PEP-CTERM system TPR-repeat protein PrsT [Methyloprofundus sp.]|nr:PEP-CTERM system TPR-repeat protein PrsT [Methyloprofundus sp.]MDT8425643.1 PEP-CTERM system TPR-repeat protein PrsT [Methyloprofundus sp.]